MNELEKIMEKEKISGEKAKLLKLKKKKSLEKTNNKIGIEFSKKFNVSTLQEANALMDEIIHKQNITRFNNNHEIRIFNSLTELADNTLIKNDSKTKEFTLINEYEVINFLKYFRSDS